MLLGSFLGDLYKKSKDVARLEMLADVSLLLAESLETTFMSLVFNKKLLIPLIAAVKLMERKALVYWIVITCNERSGGTGKLFKQAIDSVAEFKDVGNRIGSCANLGGVLGWFPMSKKK